MPEFTGRLRTPRLAAAPSSPVVGEVYYNTASNKLFWWSGTAWVEAMDAGGGGAGSIPIEAWHEVGAAGEPAFQNGWLNYQPGTWPTMAFRLRPDGIVEMKGMIKSGTMAGAIFTLPAAYRPVDNRIFAADATGGFAELRVYSDGAVTQSVGANTWLSMETVRYPTAQTTFPGVVGPQGPPGGGTVNKINQTWAITAAYTKDRSINPNSTTVNELAAMMSTLIDDMKAAGLMNP